ncbi:potassium-transporting ATPase subunit B, partial [Kitasatospora sp. NPDC001159]
MSTPTLTPSPAPVGKSDGKASHRVASGLLDPKLIVTSLPDAVKKLDPRVMVKNPVMFVVEVGSVVTTISAIA